MLLSDEQWRQKLTPEQYEVLRQKGTEAPFSGELLNNSKPGEYRCAACGSVVFSSDDKYDSDIPSLAGWPSFAEVASSNAVDLKDDTSNGMQRVEAVCKKCGSHLGHLFDDKTSPTNKHYCINSCALDFKPVRPKD